MLEVEGRQQPRLLPSLPGGLAAAGSGLFGLLSGLSA